MSKKGLIVDLDGTVYWQNTPIPGAIEALNNLKNQGHKICYLTNNATKRNEDYFFKLKNMGLEVELEDIFSAPLLAASYLSETLKAGSRIWVEGEPALYEVVKQAGIPIANKPEDADATLLGGGPSFTDKKLNNLFQAYLKGASMFAVNPDVTCPIGETFIPDTGAYIAALESMMHPGDKINIIGKPSVIAVKQILNHIKIPKHHCFVIGDRLDTDIKMANESNMHSVLVLTGVTKQSDISRRTKYKPDTVLTALSDLTSLDKCK